MKVKGKSGLLNLLGMIWASGPAPSYEERVMMAVVVEIIETCDEKRIDELIQKWENARDVDLPK